MLRGFDGYLARDGVEHLLSFGARRRVSGSGGVRLVKDLAASFVTWMSNAEFGEEITSRTSNDPEFPWIGRPLVVCNAT